MRKNAVYRAVSGQIETVPLEKRLMVFCLYSTIQESVSVTVRAALIGYGSCDYHMIYINIVRWLLISLYLHIFLFFEETIQLSEVLSFSKHAPWKASGAK